MNKLYVVGTGPGKDEYIAPAAVSAMNDSEIIVGYTRYIKQIAHLVESKEIVQTGMHGEVERCKKAVELAAEGKKVALVSGGDAGVYGMAGLIYEIVMQEKVDVDVEVVPGITSATASASLLGAPLMHDFVTISLSNWLTDIELIKKRIECAGIGDFVIVIYNPKSKARPDIIDSAREILLKFKDATTPVGLVRNAYRDNQQIEITNLDDMCKCEINMSTTVVIGNSKTFVSDGKMVTPRGYSV